MLVPKERDSGVLRHPGGAMVKLKAEEVLEDCRHALASLTDGVQGSDWRRKWVLTVALLRAVGHVLKKVDVDAVPELEQPVREWWTNLQQSKPPIWGFIESERNNILKAYEFGAGQGVTIHVGKGAQYRYLVNRSPYEGRDQREIIGEAIHWWEQQLAWLKAKVK